MKELQRIILNELNNLFEVQKVPRVGDWYSDEDFNHHEIKRVNTKKRWIDVWIEDPGRDPWMCRIDLWNIEYGGNLKGKTVWRTNIRR